MLGPHFYNEAIRKTVIGFGTLFNNIEVRKYDLSTGDVIEAEKVPLAYGPKNKFLTRLEQNPSVDNKVAITVPRLYFEMTGISYDSARKTAPTQKYKTVINTDGSEIKMQYVPIPYNMEFELGIMCKLNDDMLQIIEQILPYFQPSYNLTVDLVKTIGEKRDISVVLDNISFQDDYEGDFSTRRALIYTLQFTAKTYMFGPIADTTDGLIRKVQVDYYADTNRETAKRELRYTTTPKALKDYNDDNTAILREPLTKTETRVSVSTSSGLVVEKMTVPSSLDNSVTLFKSTSERPTTVALGTCSLINLACPAPITPVPIIPTFIIFLSPRF